MKKLAVLFSIILNLSGCHDQEKHKQIIAEHKKDSLLQVKRNESIRIKSVEDSILVTKFIKWIKPSVKTHNINDTTFINKFYKNDIDASLDFVDLKIRPNTLSLIMTKEQDFRFKNGNYIYLSISRFSPISLNISTEELNMYDPTTYFKLSITDEKSGKITTYSFADYHKNTSTDENLLKAISDHLYDKIQIEEFFAREVEGHFEGESQSKDLRVRSFYLSWENLLAIKESYQLFLLLDKGN